MYCKKLAFYFFVLEDGLKKEALYPNNSSIFFIYVLYINFEGHYPNPCDAFSGCQNNGCY